jgi:murein L,D-transpeptidase YafK
MWRAGALVVAFVNAAVAGTGAADVPSSARSREAVSRVKPRLVKALQARGLAFGAPIYVRIFKHERQLELWVEDDGRYQLFNTYDICRYSGDLGPKLREGDGQSPEGLYLVRPRQLNPLSRLYLSFDIGYPNTYDRAHARTGNAPMVHGSCVSIGCYAMTNASIEEIYTMADAAFREGQPAFAVHIFPFRPTAHKFARHRGSRWEEFWRDLKTAYDLFEVRRVPPRTTVLKGRYVISPAP